MHEVFSSAPGVQLQKYVRAYAQRETTAASPLREPFVASLEPVLQFDFAEPVQLRLDLGTTLKSEIVSAVGLRTRTTGTLEFNGPIESFAIFFQPLGMEQLLGVPVTELVNGHAHATHLLGLAAMHLWHELADATSFHQRVAIVEQFLVCRLAGVAAHTPISAAAAHLFRRRGLLRVTEVAGLCSGSLRQFERNFAAQIGMHPKLFARIARFQHAVDLKLHRPSTSWIDVAHAYGYYDQAHMIRDFRDLGSLTPGKLIDSLGDVRPAALGFGTDKGMAATAGTHRQRHA